MDPGSSDMTLSSSSPIGLSTFLRPCSAFGCRVPVLKTKKAVVEEEFDALVKTRLAEIEAEHERSEL